MRSERTENAEAPIEVMDTMRKHLKNVSQSFPSTTTLSFNELHLYHNAWSILSTYYQQHQMYTQIQSLFKIQEKWHLDIFPRCIENVDKEKIILENTLSSLRETANNLLTNPYNIPASSLFASLESRSTSAYYYSIDLEITSLEKLLNNDAFKQSLKELGVDLKTFTTNSNTINELKIKINKMQKYINGITEFPVPVRVVLSFIQHPEQKILQDYITKHLLKHLPYIFECLQQMKDTEDKLLFNDNKFREAQEQIYKSIAASNISKTKHIQRIAVASFLSIILTPLSLLLTIPWIKNRKKETFIEKRTLSQKDYIELKTFRSSYKSRIKTDNDATKKDTLFNNQGELRKIVTDGKDANKVIFMKSEQAKRFDAWLELKKSTSAQDKSTKIPDNYSQLFNASKRREKSDHLKSEQHFKHR